MNACYKLSKYDEWMDGWVDGCYDLLSPPLRPPLPNLTLGGTNRRVDIVLVSSSTAASTDSGRSVGRVVDSLDMVEF